MIAKVWELIFPTTRGVPCHWSNNRPTNAWAIHCSLACTKVLKNNFRTYKKMKVKSCVLDMVNLTMGKLQLHYRPKLMQREVCFSYHAYFKCGSTNYFKKPSWRHAWINWRRYLQNSNGHQNQLPYLISAFCQLSLQVKLSSRDVNR